MLDSEIHHDPRFTVQKVDVFGEYDHSKHKKVDNGMVVAKQGQVCPIFGDQVPYKAVTVVCQPEQESEVEYWLMYVHGGPWSRRGVLEDGRIALRSQYQAW